MQIDVMQINIHYTILIVRSAEIHIHFFSPLIPYILKQVNCISNECDICTSKAKEAAVKCLSTYLFQTAVDWVIREECPLPRHFCL